MLAVCAQSGRRVPSDPSGEEIVLAAMWTVVGAERGALATIWTGCLMPSGRPRRCSHDGRSRPGRRPERDRIALPSDVLCAIRGQGLQLRQVRRGRDCPTEGRHPRREACEVPNGPGIHLRPSRPEALVARRDDRAFGGHPTPTWHRPHLSRRRAPRGARLLQGLHHPYRHEEPDPRPPAESHRPGLEPWSASPGRGPMLDLLLAATGRVSGCDGLSGDCVDTLRARCG
jgi:hypothetical protein